MRKINELEMRMLEAGASHPSFDISIDGKGLDDHQDEGFELTMFGYTFRINLIGDGFKGISIFNRSKDEYYLIKGFGDNAFMKMFNLNGFSIGYK